jgi:hypothetical protein
VSNPNYAKYIVGLLTAFDLVYWFAGFVLGDADHLLGAFLFSFMLLIGYYIPAILVSKNVPRNQKPFWIVFFLCLNVLAMMAFWHTYIYETSSGRRYRGEEE